MKDRISRWIVDSGMPYEIIVILSTLAMALAVYLERDKIKNWNTASGLDKLQVIVAVVCFIGLFIFTIHFIFFMDR
jgi:hypothetical protein